jgi:hypothetical protein
VNTYQVTWYPPVSSTPGSATVQASIFEYTEDAVLFFDDAKQVVMAVSIELHPVVQKTA